VRVDAGHDVEQLGQAMWFNWVLGVFFVAIVSFAIWKNMSDGRGNNAKSTRNRGISGDG
jgi:hypothetical protein